MVQERQMTPSMGHKEGVVRVYIHPKVVMQRTYVSTVINQNFLNIIFRHEGAKISKNNKSQKSCRIGRFTSIPVFVKIRRHLRSIT